MEERTVADGVLDSLVHNSIKVELFGESMRKAQARPANTSLSIVGQAVISLTILQSTIALRYQQWDDLKTCRQSTCLVPANTTVEYILDGRKRM